MHEIFWSVFPLDPVLGQGAVPEANESESHICNEHPLISQVVFFSARYFGPLPHNDSALIILIVGGSETKLDRCISDGASMLEPHISPLHRMGGGVKQVQRPIS